MKDAETDNHSIEFTGNAKLISRIDVTNDFVMAVMKEGDTTIQKLRQMARGLQFGRLAQSQRLKYITVL